jgi:hypothetical protein
MAGPALSYPHVATLWRLTGVDQFNDQTWSGPIRVECRWSDRGVLYRDPSGREAVSRSVVAVKDQEIAVGDFLLFAGNKRDNPVTSTSATPASGADEIRQMNDVDSIDGRWTRRRAFL